MGQVSRPQSREYPSLGLKVTPGVVTPPHLTHMTHPHCSRCLPRNLQITIPPVGHSLSNVQMGRRTCYGLGIYCTSRSVVGTARMMEAARELRSAGRKVLWVFLFLIAFLSILQESLGCWKQNLKIF